MNKFAKIFLVFSLAVFLLGINFDLASAAVKCRCGEGELNCPGEDCMSCSSTSPGECTLISTTSIKCRCGEGILDCQGNSCMSCNSTSPGECSPITSGGGTGSQQGGSGTGSQGGAVSLTNPLGNITDPNQIIGNVIRAILGIVGSLALAVFIFGGFTWVISAGNEEKIKKGKDMILWATLGLVVIFFSYAMVTFVLQAIGGST